MVYILTGEDDYTLRQELDRIKRSIGDQTALAANTTVFDGQRLTPDQLRAACNTVPFLAEKRLVIVEGLLERFERRNKSGQGRKAVRQPDQQNGHKSIAACIGQVPDFTLLVLVDGKIDSRNPLLVEISPGAEVKFFPLLRDASLRQWIQQRVTEAGGTISPRAINLLVRLVGGNLWVMAGEVSKLVLFAKGRTIEEGDVSAMVSSAQEASVFHMVDAIIEFRADAAEKLLAQLLQRGAAPAYLLVMLSRQAEIIVRVKELKNQGKSRQQIQDRLAPVPEFVLRKALEQADGYSPARLKEICHRLLEADMSIKTGRLDGELTLDILVAELCYRP